MHTSKSIFLCTYVFEINHSTKHIRSFTTKKVEKIVARGMDKDALMKDKYALSRALHYGQIKSKRWRLVDVVIEKYLSESFY